MIVTTDTDRRHDDNVSHAAKATAAATADQQTKNPLVSSLGKKRRLPTQTEDSDSDSCSSASSSSFSSSSSSDDGEDSSREVRQPQQQHYHQPEWKKRKTVHPSPSCSGREEHDKNILSVVVTSHDDDTDGVDTNHATDEDSSTKKAVRFVPSDQNEIYETLARSNYTPQEFDDSFLSQQEQRQTYREIAMHIRQYRADKEKRQQKQKQDSHDIDVDEVSASTTTTTSNNNKFQQLHTRKADLVANVVAAATESENEEKYGCLESIIEQRDSDRSERMRLACSIILKAQSQSQSQPQPSSSSSSSAALKKKGKLPPKPVINDDAWLDDHYRPISTIAAKLARNRGICEEKAAKVATRDSDTSAENLSTGKDETSGSSATATRPASRTIPATTPTRDQQRSPLKVIACC
mmetsp:Transcript_21687/g.51212  ORF Transcript_21687/g.51212 Transcript_21687/m.51212 type:complete len:408 (-) Transcript_21687:186-1409(-)